MLQDFDIGDGGVRHVGVQRVRAVVSIPGAGAAAECFVVAELVVAEDYVVHGSLAAGLEMERFDQRINQPLTGLNIAAYHSWALSGIRGEGWIQKTPRQVNGNILQQPFVEGQCFLKQEPKHVQDCTSDDCGCGVEVPAVLGAGAGETDLQVLPEFLK